MKLRFERGALADLGEIFAYIAKTTAGQRPNSLHVSNRRQLIAEQPHLGAVTRNPKFRRFPVGNYLIVYEVGPNEVVIHYVRHGARLRPWEGD